MNSSILNGPAAPKSPAVLDFSRVGSELEKMDGATGGRFWEFVEKYGRILDKFNRVHSLTNYKNIKAVALDSVTPLFFGGLAAGEARHLGGLDGGDKLGGGEKKDGFLDTTELFTSIKPAKTAIDIGSGAGFPAIFLAFLMPGCEWILFEPIAKKSSFLSYAAVELNLKNVRVKSHKIEAFSPKIRADLITSRALMQTKKLIELCAGYYDKNTTFLVYKGQNAQNELDDFLSITPHKPQNIVISDSAKNKNNRHFLILRDLVC